jgi:hypothetical protein
MSHMVPLWLAKKASRRSQPDDAAQARLWDVGQVGDILDRRAPHQRDAGQNLELTKPPQTREDFALESR